jgi:hypothetical protein
MKRAKTITNFSPTSFPQRVPSLTKLSALMFSNELNKKIKIEEDIVEVLRRVPHNILVILIPFLHYRWAEKVAEILGQIDSNLMPFIFGSMRREEDFQRSKQDVEVPLLNVFNESKSFVTKSFPGNCEKNFCEISDKKLCLVPKVYEEESDY